MPQRTFALSYLIYPQEYEKEVSGVEIPLSFSIVDKEGYVVNYIPVSLYDSDKLIAALLAERRPIIHEADRSELEAGESSREHESDIQTAIGSDKSEKTSSSIYELSVAEWLEKYGDLHYLKQSVKEHGEAENLIVTLADATKIWDGIVHDSLFTAEEAISHKEMTLTSVFTAETKEYHDIETLISYSANRIETTASAELNELFTTAVRNELYAGLYKGKQADREKNTAARLLSAFSLGEVESRNGRLMKTLSAIRENHGARIVHKVVQGFREGRGARTMLRFVQALRESYGAQGMKKVIQALKEADGASILKRVTFSVKEKHGGRITEDFKLFEKETYNSFRMARIVYAVAEEKGARRDTMVIQGDWKKEHVGVLSHPVMLAEYGSAEAFIQKSLTVMEKAGIAGAFLKSVMADSKAERVSDILENLEAETKAEHDAIIDEAVMADTKNAWDSVVSKLKGGFKQEKMSGWIERVILAVQSVEYHQAFIDRMLEFGDDGTKESFVEALLAAEVPDPEGLMHELELAWNKDKPNRPAGIMGDFKGAWWDLGFDDLMDTWDEGWDYLDPPNNDYNYEKHKSEVYDINGVPLDPLGPINLADVDVKTPLNHPHPDWADVGTKESWVEMYTFQDVVMNIATIWKKDQSRIAGMTGQQAIQDVLKQLYQFLQESTTWDKQYQRMFRFVRWNAERISHKDSITVLHRTYENWTDKIVSSGGVFTHPHVIDQMAVQPTGVIESLSTIGSLEFSVENYIDGSLTFSTSISSSNVASTSTIELYIDGVLTHTFTVPDGVQRLSFDVPMGNHTYRFAYAAEVGDIVKLSGFAITGVHFAEAMTTQRDAGTTRGMKAVDHLIQALLTYYQKHHKDKSKGAMAVYQRKIWLS